MCGDVLSCARVESDGDCVVPLCAAVPTAIRAARRAVKPDGISTSRTADGGNAARERTTRSRPGGHRKIFPKHRLGADPRVPLGRTARQQPVPPPAAGAPALNTDNSGTDGTRGHLPSSARSGGHAKNATALPLADTPDCNTVLAATGAQRTARTPSADNAAVSAPDKSLAPDKIVDHDEVEPRERQLPKVKSRRGASTPLRDALYPQPYPSASLPFRLLTRSLSVEHL